jgi:hypothetical protein
MGPVAVVLFTFLIMMVFGAVGYFYNGEVRRGFGDEIVGIVAVTSEMLKEAELLTFTLLTQLTGLLDTAPVLDTVVPELTGMISPLNEGADGFANLTVQTGFYMNATDLVVEGQGEALYTSPDVNILCAMCRSAEDDLAQIAEDVRVSSADSFAELQDSVNNADIWLSEFRFLLEEGGDIEWAQTQANDMDVYLSESRETLSDYIAWMNDMDEVRWTFTILFFGLPFICFALVLAGFCLKNSACLRCNIVVSFFQLFICWLMFTFHLPIAMVLSDTCSYMAQVESNPLEALNLTETSSSVFLACLANTSLVDAMNITDDLQFADLVWFPDPMPDADTMFDLQTLYDYEEDALNQTVADFYDADVVDTAFSALNVYTDPDVFDETNIESCDPTVYTDTTEVRTLKWDIITGLDAADSANNTATEINQNVTGLVSAADSLKTDTNVIISDLDGVVAQMDPIIDNTEGFVTSAYCGSIGDQYFLFKVALCDVETTAFSYLALSFFMIGVFQFFNLWVNIVMIKRIHHEEHESKRTKGGHRRRNPDGSHHDPDHQGEEFTDIATAQDDSNANLRIHLRESVSRQGSRHGQTPPVHSRSLRRQQPKRMAQTPRGTRRQARPSVAPRFDAHAQPAHASSGPARPVQQGSQSARVTGRRLRRKKSSKADNTNVIEMGNLKITYD